MKAMIIKATGLKLMLFLIVMGMTLHSCQEDESALLPPAGKEEDILLSFLADESSTKTHWDGNTISWSEGDCISAVCVSNGQYSNLYESLPLEKDCSKAEFSIPFSSLSLTGGDLSFSTIYPSSCISGDVSNSPTVSVELPLWQTPSASSYDKDADIMVGSSLETYKQIPSESIPLVWTRLVAHADILLSSLDIPEDELLRTVTLTADPESAFTGSCGLDMANNTLTPSKTSNQVKLDVEALSLVNKTLRVWASVLPSKVKSLEVEVLTSKAIYRRAISSCDLELKVNSRNTLEIDMASAVRSAMNEPAGLVKTRHPRLFITADDIPLMKANAAGLSSDVYSAMKKRVDKLMTAGITFTDPLAATGESNDNHEVGFRAVEAATVWLVSGDRTYLEHTKTILRELTAYYQLRVDNNLNIAWYVYSQITALCAYDWIYNDLTEAERTELGVPLYTAMHEIAWHGKGVRPSRYRENNSEPEKGCYGVSILPWYLSLAFYGDGVNDKRCEEMFVQGYEFHMKMAAHRHAMAGTKGGCATSCPTYSVGGYQFADFNFLRTYHSATGVDISENLDYVLKYMDYLDWIRLPDEEKVGSARDFGLGDSHHSNCRLSYQDINYNILEIADIYGQRHPEILPQAAVMLRQFSSKRAADRFPFMRLLHAIYPEDNGEASLGNSGQKSIYFDTMGQVYMRTGDAADDTYAVFVSGGVPTNHKHYDNNHFVLYKKGYRALDSGTRPEPGQHLSHYFSRTVAHNCVTVRMPGEAFPKYWGDPAPGEEVLPVPNDGGQNQLLASVLKELRETDDYVYLASDASEAYNSAKASLVMREFVWCVPDIFIVFDRVTSTDATYPKTWLYHTAAEPQINGLEFTETSQGGKSICRTLFPSDAVLEKIGGPGRQFWSDGRNWPLPADKSAIVPDEDHPLLGQWRMEVKPGAERAEDVFMHIIQVGNESLAALPQTTTFESSSEIGVEFTYNGKSWRVAFDKTADYGCVISTE